MIWNPWKEIRRLRREIEFSRQAYTDRLEIRQQFADSANAGRSALIDVLRDIIAEEKPTSNATVKRMARMAREALKV